MSASQYIELHDEHIVTKELNAIELDEWRALPESTRRTIVEMFNSAKIRAEYEYGEGYNDGVYDEKRRTDRANMYLNDALHDLQAEDYESLEANLNRLATEL